MKYWILILATIIAALSAAVLVPTSIPSGVQVQSRIIYAQQPTATAACAGCKALRHEFLSGGDSARYEVKGEFGAPPLPCIKTVNNARSDAMHPIIIVGPRKNLASFPVTSTEERIEIGFVTTNWTAPSSFLYTYCSFCDSGIRKWKFVKATNKLTSPVKVRIVVNADTPQSIDWFFTEGSGSEQTANTLVSPNSNFRFVPDRIYAGGYTSDSRNDLGVHETRDVLHKVGTGGSFSSWSPSPGHGWQEYYRQRYITQWIDPRLLVFSDVHLGGSSVCP